MDARLKRPLTQRNIIYKQDAGEGCFGNKLGHFLSDVDLVIIAPFDFVTIYDG